MLIVAFREHGWMDYKTDYRQWDNLCRCYGVESVIVEDWDEAYRIGPVVVVDEVGVIPLPDFEHPLGGVYVFGRSNLNDLPERIEHDYSVRIDTPYSKSMFGISVAGAVLYDRATKGWQPEPH